MNDNTTKQKAAMMLTRSSPVTETAIAWRVTAGENSERHLFESERDAQLMRDELEENGWLDVVLMPLYAGLAQTARDPFDICVMIVEEECVLDKPPARDDNYERAMHEVGLAIRDRIRCAQRNPGPALADSSTERK